ncbi:13970_t:CDS:2, partial [Entrophospora sp. SA101]
RIPLKDVENIDTRDSARSISPPPHPPKSQQQQQNLPPPTTASNTASLMGSSSPHIREPNRSNSLSPSPTQPSQQSSSNKNKSDKMRYELKINGINIKTLLETYRDVSLKIGKEKQLLVESNTYEILSLSYILLLIPNSYSKTIIRSFGITLLEELHLQQTSMLPKIVLADKPVYIFRKAIEMGKNDSRDVAVNWLCEQLLKEKIIKDNLGLFHDPDKTLVQWPNTELHESKIRNLASRAKQPDFTVSLIHQQQIDSVIFVGEV